MAASESDRILAPGVKVTLTDGRAVMVRYGMRSFKALEDHFGSVFAAQRALHELFVPVEVDGVMEAKNGRTIGTVLPFLAAGLLHEGITEDALYDLTDIDQLIDYAAAVGDALEQATPAQGEEGKAPEAMASPGPASTTPPPSDLAAPTPTSGA